ncbi:MAG: SusC/RagA family TonB-linked outer membrane protein [Bacteroidota bacterium]
MKNLILNFGLFFSLSSTLSLAQNIEVKGKVTEDGGEALYGVNVVVKGSREGTVTDDKGEYRMQVPSGSTLAFSYIGYESQEVVVGNNTTIHVSLKLQTSALSEVVVTALGIRKERKSLGYSTSEVKGEELIQARSPNITNTLAGKVAGLNITSTASGPSGSTRITLRGNGSITGNNQPLIVVDGIPIDNQNLGSVGMWGGPDKGDGLSSMNPDEIDNINVLKGATAAALYGSRASNGAILITTKTGKVGQGIGLEVNSNFVAEDLLIKSFKDYQYEYGTGINGQKPTTALVARTTNSWGGKLDGSNVIQYDGVSRPYVAEKDNLKNFYKTGFTFTNSVAISGATDKVSYRFSMNNLDNRGIVPHNTLHRNNFALNTNATLGKNLTVLANVKYITEKNHNRPRLSDSPGNANYTLFTMPTSLSVATLRENIYDSQGFEKQWSENEYVQNPYFAASDFLQDDKKDRIIGAVEPKYQLTEWLSIGARLGFDAYSYRNTESRPTGTAFDRAGRIDTDLRNFIESNSSLNLTLNRDITSDLNLNLLVGGNLMKQVNRIDHYDGAGFNIPFFYDITNINPEKRTVRYNYTERRINSIYSSADLSFRNYLFLNLSGRNDWFSTLAPDKNSIFYPSIGAGFVLSEAVELPEVINYFKLRGSWAQAGGDTDPYNLSLYYTLTGAHLGQPLAQIKDDPNQVPNPSLQPLTSSTGEAGFETRLFESRLGIDFALYTRKTTNDIVAASISGTSGFASALFNVGEVTNKGIELLLNYAVIKSPNFTWDVSFNYAYNKSQVVALYGDQKNFQVGDPARSQAAYVFQEVGQPFSLIKGYAYQRDATGNIIYNTTTGLPLRESELTPYGTGVSPTTLGFTNSFRYKGIGLSFLIDGKFGGHIYSGSNALAYRHGLHVETLPGRETGVVGVGVNEAGERNTVNVPAQQYYENLYNFAEPFIYSSDFLKLRQVIIDYTIPAKLFGRTPFKGASISLVGRNLAILMKKTPNIDPESTYNNTNGQGLEFTGAPYTRSVGLNLNLKF